MKRFLLGLLVALMVVLPGTSDAQDADGARIRIINLYYETAGSLTIGAQTVDIAAAPSATDYVAFDDNSSGYSIQFGGNIRGSTAEFDSGHDYMMLVIAEAADTGTAVVIDETALTVAFPASEAQLQVLHYVTGLDNARYTLQSDDNSLTWYQQASFGALDAGFAVKTMSLPAGDYILAAEGLLADASLALNAAEQKTVVVSGHYPDNVVAAMITGTTVTSLDTSDNEIMLSIPDTNIANISVFNIARETQLDTLIGESGSHSLAYGEWGDALDFDVSSGQPPAFTFIREDGFTGTSPIATFIGGHDYLLIGVEAPTQSDSFTATQTIVVLDLTHLVGPLEEDTAGLIVVNVTNNPDTMSLLDDSGETMVSQYLAASFGFGVEIDDAVMAFRLTAGDYAIDGPFVDVDLNLAAGQTTIVVIGALDTFVIQGGVVR
jgi:hypothetical protein